MIFNSFLAPAKTPKEITDKLYTNLKIILEDKEFQNQMLVNGVVLQAKSPTEFGTFIKGETNRWGKFLKTTGISIEN